MSETIKTKYKGEEITYYEYNEQWSWKNCSNPSLAKVKAYIDRSLRTDFPRTSALYREWRMSGSDEHITVTVTSRAEDGDYWITKPDKKREKVSADRLFTISDQNQAILATITERQKEISKLIKLQAADLKQMEAFAAPSEVK